MKLDDKGLSLIQALIAASILGISSYISIRMMRQQIAIVRSTSASFEISYKLADITRILQDKKSCYKTLKDENDIKYITQEFFDKKLGEVLDFTFYKVDQKNKRKELASIKEYKLKKIDNDHSYLQITFKRDSKSLGQSEVIKNIEIITIRDDQKKILSCIASSATADSNSNNEWNFDTKKKSILSKKDFVSIGAIPSRASLTITGQLLLSSNNNMATKCNENSAGTLKIDEGLNQLVFCSPKEGWIGLTQTPKNWSKPILYSLTSRNKLNLPPLSHRLCILTLTNQDQGTTCNTRKNSNGEWLLSFSQKDETSFFQCEYKCYN